MVDAPDLEHELYDWLEASCPGLSFDVGTHVELPYVTFSVRGTYDKWSAVCDTRILGRDEATNHMDVIASAIVRRIAWDIAAQMFSVTLTISKPGAPEDILK